MLYQKKQTREDKDYEKLQIEQYEVNENFGGSKTRRMRRW